MSDEQNQDEDKQYEPTQRKLDEARKKGDIAKSMDIVTAAAYGGFLIGALAAGPYILLNTGAALRFFLDQSQESADLVFSGSAINVLGFMLQDVANVSTLWFVMPISLVVVALLAQRAFVFAGSKIALKASRISLISGAKQKFGRNGLFEFLKSFTKLSIYSLVLGIYCFALLDHIVGSIYLTPAQISAELLRLVIGLIFIVFLVASAIGIVDFLWQRSEHHRKNRMSRKEMMEELKQSEGDPVMKQQRRQKGHDLATNRMLADVPNADVVIVNPTHYAVALTWDREPGSAPVCVAKGVDEVAQRIREVAMTNGVPIHSDPPTARAIHAGVEIGEMIRQEHYAPIAVALRYADSVRKKASWRGQA